MQVLTSKFSEHAKCQSFHLYMETQHLRLSFSNNLALIITVMVMNIVHVYVNQAPAIPPSSAPSFLLIFMPSTQSSLHFAEYPVFVFTFLIFCSLDALSPFALLPFSHHLRLSSKLITSEKSSIRGSQGTTLISLLTFFHSRLQCPFVLLSPCQTASFLEVEVMISVQLYACKRFLINLNEWLVIPFILKYKVYRLPLCYLTELSR